MSHPTMGAWIEIYGITFYICMYYGRTPRWVRGLKLSLACLHCICTTSHPTMGAWIEILIVRLDFSSDFDCRTPRWVRGLKFSRRRLKNWRKGRTPRWVRGLKFLWDIFCYFLMCRRTPRWVRGLKYLILTHLLIFHMVAPHDGCVD